jgi:hypothetical protein
VLADLRAIAGHDPDWVYVFVTAHGVDSIAELWREDRSGRAALASLSREDRARLDVHALGLQADPARRLENAGALAAALRTGTPPHELFVTPATLAAALAAFPARTRKIAVLQGCYSGGFARPETLGELNNLVVLTASAHDRPSFGCGSGDARTWFGGAFNRVLARALARGRSPAQLDWRRIHDEVAFVIEVMEAVDGERPSRPAYHERATP